MSHSVYQQRIVLTKLVLAMTAVSGVTCRALADWLHMLQAMIAVLYVRVSGCTLCIPHTPFLYVVICNSKQGVGRCLPDLRLVQIMLGCLLIMVLLYVNLRAWGLPPS